MKVSYNWLSELVDLSGLTPEEIATKLTFAGVEVESISTLAKATNLVIGEILSCEKHPESDHLHVLQVDEGKKYGVHTIVCGAPNARKGLKVIVARSGAVLPEVTIVPSLIRGVNSDGMCCALYELGVDKKFLSEKSLSGIEELSADAEVGNEEVLKYLGLDDSILDLKLLANRSDLNAMENVAGEVATLFGRKLKEKEIKETATIPADFQIESHAAACPLFLGRVATSLTVGPSPKWLSQKLEAAGVRSLNNVVDIGNYAMLLTGQPINMYDLDELEERKLEVKDGFEGKFLAMDDKEYSLVKGDLVIVSGDEVLCLAGIMTSKKAAVTAKTKNVVVETALFAGPSIRHTSSRLGLVSESSSRFVKGLPGEGQEEVQRLVSSLLVELAGAKTISESAIYDVYPHQKKIIKTSLGYINARLGTSLSLEEVESTLRKDHLLIKDLGEGAFEAEIPSSRIDIGGEADLSEEVIRLLGFDRIVSHFPPLDLKDKGGFSSRQLDKLAVRRFLREHGAIECLTYSLIDEKASRKFSYIEKGENYRLLNPMTPDHEYLRANLLPSLLMVAAYNNAHQNKDFALYEMSDVDTKTNKGLHLSMVLSGEEKITGSLHPRAYDFYSLKGYFEGILDTLGLNHNRFKIERLVSDKDEFHPGRSAGIYLGRDLVGVMGELHPKAIKEYGAQKGSLALELDLAAMLSLKTSEEKALVPSKFPSVTRDLAFVVEKKVSYEEIRRVISRLDKMIVGIDLFDVYEGDNVKEGCKSLAITLTFLDETKTLKDVDVNLVMDKIVSALKTNFLAEVRQ